MSQLLDQILQISEEEWKGIFRNHPELRNRITGASASLYYEELDTELDAETVEILPPLSLVIHDEGEEPDIGE